MYVFYYYFFFMTFISQMSTLCQHFFESCLHLWNIIVIVIVDGHNNKNTFILSATEWPASSPSAGWCSRWCSCDGLQSLLKRSVYFLSSGSWVFLKPWREEAVPVSSSVFAVFNQKMSSFFSSDHREDRVSEEKVSQGETASAEELRWKQPAWMKLNVSLVHYSNRRVRFSILLKHQSHQEDSVPGCRLEDWQEIGAVRTSPRGKKPSSFSPLLENEENWRPSVLIPT